jgi:S-adenosyl-methyltransferase mraW
VLLADTLRLLAPKPGESYIDFTAGYGGHAAEVLARTGEYASSVLVDRDSNAIKFLQQRFTSAAVSFLHMSFADAAEQLVQQGRTFDIILADLGVSSPQLDQSERGFSFLHNGPLDMRMDDRQQYSAADVVNTYSEQQLIDIITQYGEEPRARARSIAHAIVQQRPFYETEPLAEAIAKALGGRRGNKRHPATRTFQALRIEVNQELQQVDRLLRCLPMLLRPGGRVGIISFHSLEDRRVKQFFAEDAKNGLESQFTVLTKKPIDGATYDVHQPRSRSAKLRVAAKQ